jgi:hypothetical protein
MACASPAYLSGTHWFLFVAVISFIATLIWIFIYFLSVREALKLPINWILTVRSRTCHIKVTGTTLPFKRSPVPLQLVVSST